MPSSVTACLTAALAALCWESAMRASATDGKPSMGNAVARRDPNGRVGMVASALGAAGAAEATSETV